MPSVADFDRELEETKRKMAQLKEGRKAALAREREQTRKWRAATTSTIGELVLETLGFGWSEVDLAALQSSLRDWAAERGESVRASALREGRAPADAKRALDTFKREQRQARTGKSPAAPPTSEGQQTEVAEQNQLSW